MRRNSANTLLGCLAGAADPVRTLRELCTSDLFLAQACARGDTTALRLFDEHLLSQVPAMLARNRARSSADEIRQLLRQRLLVAQDEGAPSRMSSYTGRGPLAGWLRVATLRAAANFSRGEPRTRPIEDALHGALDFLVAPELRVLEANYKTSFRDAFREAFAALEPAERTVLKLHFVDGVSVRKLAPILGVSHATAARRVVAAQTRLGDLALGRLGDISGTSPSELRSVVRTILSRLDISLGALTTSE